MKQALTVLGVFALVVSGVALGQRVRQDGRYRALLTQGEHALDNGQSYVAIESFSGASALRPDAMAPYYRRGAAYREQRQVDKAARDFQEAHRLAPDAPEPLISLGDLCNERGAFAEAASWYGQAVLHLGDSNASLLYSLALARYRSGEPAAAKAPLKQALARDDSMAEAHYLLGAVYRDSQAIDLAVSELERAVRLAPSMLAAREELADVYRTLGQPANELAQLEALAAADQHVDRDMALALALSRRGRFSEAAEVLTAATARSPHDSRLYLGLGRVYLAWAESGGDRAALARAQAALERALGGTARRSEGLALYGRALYLSGDPAAAERILQEAVSTSPVDPEAFGYLADAAERAGHPSVAKDALLALDALEGNTASASRRGGRARRIGTVALAAGDPVTARDVLAHATEAGQTDAVTLSLLARARWQTGDAIGARTALGQAIALNSTDAELQRLLRVMR